MINMVQMMYTYGSMRDTLIGLGMLGLLLRRTSNAATATPVDTQTLSSSIKHDTIVKVHKFVDLTYGQS